MTSLALLAFLAANGRATGRGRYATTVERGLDWLRSRQDRQGMIVDRAPGERGFREHADLDHALATLVLCDAYRLDGRPSTRAAARRAAGYVVQHHSFAGGSSIDGTRPPLRDPTSVWTLLALTAASEAGFVQGQVVDEHGGRLMEHGRTPAGEQTWPAATILVRYLADPGAAPPGTVERERLLELLPTWAQGQLGGGGLDLAIGTYAAYQIGGPSWFRWQTEALAAVKTAQRVEGHADGSWDPQPFFGSWGGRVVSTAAGVLCLTVCERRSQLTGTY